MIGNLEQKVIDQLLHLSKNGFQEINPNAISLIFVKSEDFFMAQNRNSLLISKDCYKLNNSALKGVLAHELIHLIQYNKSPILDFLISFLYLIPFFNSKFERQIDKEVIKRGYGQELLAFIKFHDKYYKKYNKSDGLTKKEIKELLSRINNNF